MATPPPESSCAPSLLRSFWIGGFEGADHVNAAGQPLDMVKATGHLDRLEEDYRRAARLGLRSLRESIGWRLCEAPGGELDLARARRLAHAARAAGVQPLWTLMHYGVPADLSLFDDALIERFARFAAALARALRPLCPAPRIYTPINEISFLAWAASTGDLLAPAQGAIDTPVPPGQQGALPASSLLSGYQVKRRLVRAVLAGMAAIRAEDPQARFLHVEPLVHVAAPVDRPELAPLAQQIRDYQWQALDLLCGRLEPDLGGHEEALDCLGFNHYHSSQWEVQTETRLAWHLRDPRRLPLSALLQEAWQRYGRPLLLAETGHVGVGRAAWLHEVAGEVLRARALGLPLQGVCLYPLLDRPDWQEVGHWHRCGLWHVEPACAAERQALRPCADALRDWRRLPEAPRAGRRRLLVLLPTRWESLALPLQWLLRRLAGERARGRRVAHFRVQLLEPPLRQQGPPSLQCRSLGPGLDLLTLRTPNRAEHPHCMQQDLLLMQELLVPAPSAGTLCWLMRWPLDRPLDRAGLAGLPLILQPDLQALPPEGLVWEPPPDLLLYEAPEQVEAPARSMEPAPVIEPSPMPVHASVLRLPLALPPEALRLPCIGSYESQELGQLLEGLPGARLLVMNRPGQAPDKDWLAGLAALRPQWHFLLFGSRPRPAGHWPSNCRDLGELAPELLAGLLAACDAGLALDSPAALDAPMCPELLTFRSCHGLPVFRRTLAEPSQCTVLPVPESVRDLHGLIASVEGLLRSPRRPRPTQAALQRSWQSRDRAQHRALFRPLLQAFATLLDGPPPVAGTWPQTAPGPAMEAAGRPGASGGTARGASSGVSRDAGREPGGSPSRSRK